MNFVLIPGAWMGAWVWEPAADHLRAAGHQVHPVTLSGLRSEDEGISAVGLETHVNEALALLEGSNLEEVVLVGHSYSGLVAGQAAARAPERIRQTVFVEAFLPEDGKSLLDLSGLDPENEVKLIEANQGRWPAPDRAGLRQEPDLSEEQITWLLERFTGHPGRTITEPAVMTRPLSEIQATYIGRTRPPSLPEAPNWVYRNFETGHWPMVSKPDRFARLLAEVASGNE